MQSGVEISSTQSTSTAQITEQLIDKNDSSAVQLISTSKYYVEKIQQMLSKANSSELIGLNTVVSLLNNAAMALNNILFFYQSFAYRHLPNALEIGAVNQEREGAIRTFKRAKDDFDHNSLNSALVHIDNAIEEFTRTSSKKDFFDQEDTKIFYAEMLYLKAQLLVELGKYKEAALALTQVIKKNKVDVAAHNLLAFIYFHHLNDRVKARKYLLLSKNYNNSQLFANFYLNLLNKNDKEMNKNIKDLLELHTLQTLPKEKLADHPQVDEFICFKELTPVDTIPFILHEWLNFKLEKESQPKNLAQTILAFESAIEILPERIKTKYFVMLHEIKIKVFFKLVKLKKSISDFDCSDDTFMAKNALKFTKNPDERSYFFEYPVKRIDKSIQRYFSKLDVTFLRERNYANKMGKLIAQCILVGWFRNDKNAEVQNICEMAKGIRHKKGIIRKKLIDELIVSCSDDKIIEHFIEHYLKGKDLGIWFDIVPTRNITKGCSLIFLLCEYLNVNLFVYTKSEEGIIYSKELCQIQQNPETNAKTLEPNAIHLLLDLNHNKFSLLHELSTPSSIYRWTALKLCWELKKKDSNNILALAYLNERNINNDNNNTSMSLISISQPKALIQVASDSAAAVSPVQTSDGKSIKDKSDSPWSFFAKEITKEKMIATAFIFSAGVVLGRMK